jgi:integrase
LSEAKDVTYLFPEITQRIVQKALKGVYRFVKLRVRHPHDLRHTYASILLMQHYSPAYEKQLGHHSITMTVDTYGHWIPGEGKKDLDRTLGGAEKQPLRQMLKRRRAGLQRVK